jgi:hypothetical protein
MEKHQQSMSELMPDESMGHDESMDNDEHP